MNLGLRGTRLELSLQQYAAAETDAIAPAAAADDDNDDYGYAFLDR